MTTLRSGRLLPVIAAALIAALALAGSAQAKVQVKYSVLKGFKAEGTPADMNKVGVLKTGDPKAPNVLVLNPGTSAGGAYFQPLAKTIVKDLPKWQVWSVERRENFLEDQSELDKLKSGDADGQQLFDYYLGYLTDDSVTQHYTPVQDADVPFARNWGMNVEVQDLRRVVKQASKHGRNVVMGGHSLGGSITTAYATWNFKGKAGGADLSGLDLIDGASSPTAITAQQASDSLANLQSSSPWLNFGGIPAPFAGLFGMVGSAETKAAPNAPSPLQDWPLLPANLHTPVPATNEAGFGYATDVGTSPASLSAAQVHAGHLADSGDPRGWVRDGAITPIQRWADMFSGWNVQGMDGTAWYHPRRLTIDSGAVGNGLANPAQDVLNVHSTMGDKLPKSMRIYAFGAALGGARVPAAAQALAAQSGIPEKNLVLQNRSATYAHNDPNSAAPKVNQFIKKLIPFLRSVRQR
jgi:pimeloyl-ACP methyl ester carboxylesterase